MRFRTTVRQSGKTTTGIQVPEEVVEALGSGKRPPVKVTVNGYTYRNRSWQVLQVDGAKTEETRQRRIAKSVTALKQGRAR